MTNVVYQIGKNGISDNSINDICNQLKKDKIVNVKLLKSFLGSTTRFEASELIISKIPFDVQKKIIGNVLRISKKQKI